jgi:menaquinone-dependent protoporphyrinogen oxidase
MPARRILIVYGTSHGQTARIALRMADLLMTSGDSGTLTDADAVPHGLTPRDYDGVIVGSSVTYDYHQRCARRFARAHRDALNAMPSAFFSVSGAAASQDAEGQARARRYVEEFLQETGWRPQLTEAVAGAMAYTKYGPLLRWITRRAAAKAGGATDTSRDHEFTDWAQVQRFAEAFAAIVPRAADNRRLITA